MGIITQKPFFEWEELNFLGDLERLALVLGFIPDKGLITALESLRTNGRDDYPVEAVWNSILAGIVFQHPSIESLRRELLRNAQLRQQCGFDLLRGEKAVPSSWAYSRFLKNLMRLEKQIEEMFETLVGRLAELVPGFGKKLALDGKAISSFGKAASEGKEPDGRRDVDANWGMKTSSGSDENGKAWEKVTRWFGYKLHLIVDSDFELPVTFKLTKASEAEQPVGLELIRELSDKAPLVAERAEYLTADRGYDDSKILNECWQGKNKIKPVIDIRNCWKDGETTKPVRELENVVYDYKGTVSCVCLKSGTQREMAYGGFEKDRERHKYLCPAVHYGISCEGFAGCPVKNQVRIPLSEDRRIFTPVARSTGKWNRLYKSRTAVERVNSRIDNVFGFEKHFIRGLKKMHLRVSLALIVMLAMAYGRVANKQGDLLRSLVRSAA